jgi:hypothetical protein
MPESADSFLLRLEERCARERAAMRKAANEFMPLLDDHDSKGTTLDREFNAFVEHLANISSFLKPDDSRRAQLKVQHIEILLQFRSGIPKTLSNKIKEDVRSILGYQIDYSRLRSKKFRDMLEYEGTGADVESE